jgi:DNA polymerase-3 subunit delta'
MRGIVGHTEAWSHLARAARSGQVAHAYLLTGPESIGKTTLALEFAKLLLCERPDAATGEPCGGCAPCRKISHGNHPDVRLIEPRDGKRQLGVDVAREEVVRLANRAPSEGRWRVFILPSAEHMTASTVNALLKTLEEPPDGVVLLLTSAEPENLLPTLLSRCQLLPLRGVMRDDILRTLIEREKVDGARAEELTDLANGRLGWALRAAEQPELREERARLLEQIVGLTPATRDARIRAAAALASDAETARRALDVWIWWWRDVTLAACGATHLASAGQARRDAERQGHAIGDRQADAFLRALLAARAALDQNANPRLTFDVLMLDLPLLTGGHARSPAV